jgi:hypothetical protein
MDGKNNVVCKALSLVTDMNATLGKEFEAGLAAMKVAAERGPATAAR